MRKATRTSSRVVWDEANLAANEEIKAEFAGIKVSAAHVLDLHPSG